MNTLKPSKTLRFSLGLACAAALSACGGNTEVSVQGPSNAVFEAGTPTAAASNVETDAALSLTVIDLQTAEITVLP